MDLESESSALESVEDNEGIAYPSQKLLDNGDDEAKVGSNGIRVHEKRDNGNVNLESGVGVVGVNSPAVVTGKSSPASPTLSPSPGGTKGIGLRKWRRIKRDVVKEGGSSVDANKFLKRGLSNSGANLSKPMQFSGGMKQNSEGSVSSTNAFVRSPGIGVDLFAAIGDSRVGLGVGNGTDSENSEDRSSKSSTAASGPKMTGYALEKNRTRNMSGKNLGNSVQRGQTGKGRSETSKKLRGEMVKIEKENSHSSMESDSRSSNFLFMQGLNSVTSNGRQSGRSQNIDGENSDEAQGSDRQPSEEPQVGSSGKNGVAFEDNYQVELAADSSWRTKEGENENNEPSRDEDPLLDSISSLQLAKEALEKEIQKFMEIGKADSTPDDSSQGGSLEQLQSTDLGEQLFDSLEPEVIKLKQTKKVLESRVDNAEALLKVKDAAILELQESTSYEDRSAKIETGFPTKLNQENYADLEIELEGLFKQKIEAEVEYLAISRKVQNLRVSLVVDQMAVLEEQRKEQSQILNKLEDSEVKAAKLKVEAEKLENYCEDIVSTDDTIKLKTRIYKYTSCLFIQLMLLLTIIILFIWQLLPSYSEVVPT